MKSQQGYTIIEVLIGLLLLGIMFVVYAASANTLVLNKNAKHEDLALRIAQTEIADLRNTAYNSLPASGSFTSTLMSSLPSGSGTITITSYNTYTKQIVVQVSWKEGPNSNTHTVTLTTLKSPGGI